MMPVAALFSAADAAKAKPNILCIADVGLGFDHTCVMSSTEIRTPALGKLTCDGTIRSSFCVQSVYLDIKQQTGKNRFARVLHSYL
jgi:hypothetical protein